MHKAQVYYDLEKLQIIRRENVSKEERKQFQEMDLDSLPEEVFWDSNVEGRNFWRYPKADMPDEKINMLLATRNAVNINLIKNCVLFFLVLTVISMLVTVAFAMK